MTKAALEKPGRWTYADYRTWPEEERWELIGGEAYDMCPSPSTTHQSVSFQLGLVLGNFFRDRRCRVLAAPVDVLLPSSDEADELVDTVVQPDLLVICDRGKISERAVRGAPDLVVEILSPSTAKKDEGVKRDRYEQAGVAEYWLVHPVDHTVFRYALMNGRYGRPEVFGAGDAMASTRFPGLLVVWDEVFETGSSEDSSPEPDSRMTRSATSRIGP
ncbi:MULTISPECIES: Uma2 family endonuclease [Methylococcus]|jgi:Uma2 family endonuclease|uniref:Uma2 family endonuclease n=1 Tax=Methylococcus TaxID=413 RepID=UPI00031FE852|nr:Uma2 family endonuclease [Methylococcus capsulatus]